MKKEKKEIKIADLNDIFVYKVDKNYVYCAPFSKTGYILSNKEAKDTKELKEIKKSYLYNMHTSYTSPFLSLHIKRWPQTSQYPPLAKILIPQQGQ